MHVAYDNQENCTIRSCEALNSSGELQTCIHADAIISASKAPKAACPVAHRFRSAVAVVHILCFQCTMRNRQTPVHDHQQRWNLKQKALKTYRYFSHILQKCCDSSTLLKFFRRYAQKTVTVMPISVVCLSRFLSSFCWSTARTHLPRAPAAPPRSRCARDDLRGAAASCLDYLLRWRLKNYGTIRTCPFLCGCEKVRWTGLEQLITDREECKTPAKTAWR